ncbi:YciI family protein [Nocardioides marmorisolisilvae]|uniref:YCII-related domain-containing protein n=1 Tax=Nocardioides marmorisolisilvae TaxID=1542737 RepID=A0A3N0DZ78_9ACTN|nr:YciI family protein [Nocardioides marmorisolisilvae]RNL80910.1 hypothetical protein EFL95_00530 [Nocardioides marmorisolisilvae]
MPEYLIAFNQEWVPELTEDDLTEANRRLTPLLAEMEAAGVWVFGGGLEENAPVVGVDLVAGKPVVMDGPYAETKEHLGGFCVVRVEDQAAALHWAQKVAVACGWPQQVHLFGAPPEA